MRDPEDGLLNRGSRTLTFVPVPWVPARGYALAGMTDEGVARAASPHV